MFRLLADDLSGALDSAAPFAAARGPLPVTWLDGELSGDAALDSETRHADEETAAASTRRLARHLRGADPAFKKIDSVLRGQPAAEIAALHRAGGFRTTVIAPAFPAQGRITRDGRLLVRDDVRSWRDAGIDLAALLSSLGLQVRRDRLEGDGIFLCDAASDDELGDIVARRGDLAPPILWCGSGGLASALAGPGTSVPLRRALPAPVRLVVGTAHPATCAQLDRLTESDLAGATRLRLPPGSAAADARDALATMTANIARQPPPASLLVTGGETLMALCRALQASGLLVEGEVLPGLPAARLMGGRWDGVHVVSKSGGFGSPNLLHTLLSREMDDPLHA